MAIAASSGTTVSQSIWQQLQTQLVQQRAAAAEDNARALQKQADDAQAAANLAQENARQLEVLASQAQTTASQAELSQAEVQSGNQTQAQLGNVSSIITQGLQSQTPIQAPAQAPAVHNTQGQVIGSVINVTA
jgi:hypothetical protein